MICVTHTTDRGQGRQGRPSHAHKLQTTSTHLWPPATATRAAVTSSHARSFATRPALIIVVPRSAQSLRSAPVRDIPLFSLSFPEPSVESISFPIQPGCGVEIKFPMCLWCPVSPLPAYLADLPARLPGGRRAKVLPTHHFRETFVAPFLFAFGLFQCSCCPLRWLPSSNPNQGQPLFGPR